MKRCVYVTYFGEITSSALMSRYKNRPCAAILFQPEYEVTLENNYKTDIDKKEIYLISIGLKHALIHKWNLPTGHRCFINGILRDLKREDFGIDLAGNKFIELRSHWEPVVCNYE
jgi:hypothetical protein